VQTPAGTDVRAGSTASIPPQPASQSDDAEAKADVNGHVPPEHAQPADPHVHRTGEDAAASQVQTPGSHGSRAMSLSNGVTPEAPPSETPASNTAPSTTQSPTVATSPSANRKPTDKFDMRPIRTELPPAFVPSAEQHTPQSTSSSNFKNVHVHPNARPHHPSASSIVFGGPNSSTSSPAPPQSADSAFQPTSYPVSVQGHLPPFVPQGHSHHASEPYVQRVQPPGYGPPGVSWNARPGYHPVPQPAFWQPHAPSSFRYPPREVFTPGEVRVPNGHYSRSRSASQTSSAAPKDVEELQSPIGGDGSAPPVKPPYIDHRVPFTPAPLQFRQHHPGHMPAAQPMPNPDMVENAEALRSHILASFGNSAFSDCHLQIFDENDGTRNYVDANKLILSRSPVLLELVQKGVTQPAAESKVQVQVSLKGAYVRMRPFMESVRYLYGGPLPSLDQYRFSTDATPLVEERMHHALENIATGAWLRVPAIAARGVDLAANILQWGTMPTVLAFALEGGLSPIWSVEDGSEDKISCSSSDDSSFSKPDSTNSPVYDPWATQLLHRMIDYTVNLLPSNFYLDSTAPQLDACPRLPSLPLGHESRPSRSDPRLSQIRFGEVPAEDHQRPSFATTTISSMLLSLPFTLLKCILEHDILAVRLGADTVSSIMRQVVAERETRRQKALKAYPAGRGDGTSETQLVQNLYWVEEVEPSQQHRAGFRLARRGRGIDTPTSSGGASEQSK
jgi:hypothetical protein